MVINFELYRGGDYVTTVPIDCDRPPEDGESFNVTKEDSGDPRVRGEYQVICWRGSGLCEAHRLDHSEI